jgi:hypothetical protein
MLAQIDALFGGIESDEQPATGGAAAPGTIGVINPTTTTATTTTTVNNARHEYIKRHQLDKAFVQAVDRAMKYKVSSPLEFVAHELMRTAEQIPSAP